MRGIALCGFMGCGKTTVAHILKTILKTEHIDTDKYIEEQNNTTINQIFENHGEQYFRDLEHSAICELSKKGGCILALGGGAVTYKRNVKTLKKSGYKIIFIDTDLDVIKERLKKDSTRPLLKSNNIDRLYKDRFEIYNTVSDIKITCKNESAQEVAKMIIDKLN